MLLITRDVMPDVLARAEREHEVRALGMVGPFDRERLLASLGGVNAILCNTSDMFDAALMNDLPPEIKVSPLTASGWSISIWRPRKRAASRYATRRACFRMRRLKCPSPSCYGRAPAGEGERLLRARKWEGITPTFHLGHAVVGKVRSGGLLLQWILGYNFSVAVWVGYIALFGIAVETGVVMVVYLHEAFERHSAGRRELTPEEMEAAVIDGAVRRLRPKLMTVSAVLAGLVPILWASGIGSDVMKPIAAPIVGGMITSTIHVLILVPIFFLMLKEKAHPRSNNANVPSAQVAK